MIIDEERYLAHFGTPRHSGRYPWGSHNNVPGSENDQSPRNMSIIDIVTDLRKQGFSDPKIAEGLGYESSTELRAIYSVALAEKKAADIAMAHRLRDEKQYSITEGARRMGIPASTFRELLKPGAMEKAKVATNIADMLQKEVDAKSFVDVGLHTEKFVGPIDSNTNLPMGVSNEKMKVALAILKQRGYEVHTVLVPQAGKPGDLRQKVLCKPGTTWADAARNRDKIQGISAFTPDHGRTFTQHHDPMILNPNRVAVRYRNEGGAEADGMIYVRPGVKDVAIGNKNYAQVRVQVGENHYIKGMAMYKDDLPPGIDVVFMANKEPTGNKMDAFKKFEDDKDPDLPFGSVTHPVLADAGVPGKERVTSVMNIVYEEGDWGEWSKALASQFLSKQSPRLAQQQLDKLYDKHSRDFEQLKSLTNPVVKKDFLVKFSDAVDSDAVDLEAAAMSRNQAWKVILPLTKIKPNECYAPSIKNGTKVVLIRYPHGGTFELPELTVNNNNLEGRRLLGDVPDAVGIHPDVAKRMSGADFDGDTVVVIPNPRGIKSTPALKSLMDFDPQSAYPKYDGMKVMTKERKEMEMGNVSNLITDMTIRGAPASEIAHAIKHSMVVIDAEKHELNWKQSEIDNGIKALKEKYQGGPRAGASTLLSKAGAKVRIPARIERRATEGGRFDVATGRRMYTETGKMRKTKSGELVPVRQQVKRMALVDNAYELIDTTPTPMERVYADHVNRMKSMANEARRLSINTPTLLQSDSAKRTYAKEASSLKSKLRIAEMNAPLERQANVLTEAIMKAKRQANPNMEKATYTKVRFKTLVECRRRTGADKKAAQIKITQREWDAIQAGAISNHMLTKIINNTDVTELRKLATPRRTPVLMNTRNITRAKEMFKRGYTREQVAAMLGVSVSTLDASVQQEELNL